MSIDYIVASLPSLEFGAGAPMTWAGFLEACGEHQSAVLKGIDEGAWKDLEIQLRNAVVEARGGAEKFIRSADGCSVFWKNRVLACFQEKDVAKREEQLDRVWWDAAGEMTSVLSPLGKGALITYGLRLKIALKRAQISQEAGNAAFDRLTAETKIEF